MVAKGAASARRRRKNMSEAAVKRVAELPLLKAAVETHDDGNVTLLTPKMISFVTLISAIFSLTYIWFRRGIFTAWDSLAFRPSDLMPGLRPDPGHSLDSEEQAQFAFIAASTHTLVLIVGMLLFTGTRLILSRSPDMATAGSSVRRGAELLLATLLSFGFYLALYTWFTFTFATRRGQPYLWARSFFYEEGGKPFASCASISYMLCLAFGYLIKYSTMDSRFSAWPPCVRQWLWSVLAGFLGAFIGFRYIAIPFYRNVTRHMLAQLDSDAVVEDQFNPNFVTLATGTHTLAFVGGMLVCFLSRRVWRFHASLAPCSGPASRLQTVLKAVTYVVWAVLVLAALVGAGMAAADYVRVHWQELPGLFLHVSHAVWFAWGYLLLAGRVPTVVNGLVSLILAPYYLTRDRPDAYLRRVWRFILVTSLYNLEKITVVLLTFSIVCGPIFPNLIMGGWTVIILSYMPTYFGTPALTGRREIVSMRGHFIFNEMAQYFRFRLFTDVAEGSLDPSHRYIFGFHPHGILPVSSGVIINTDIWRKIFAGINPAPLTSSVLHHVPLMRDFIQSMAGGDVTRRGMCSTLARRRSIMFLPGGQQEMINSCSTSPNDHVCGSHKGFCRLAMEMAAASEEPVHLVPMFNCGETAILDNAQVPKSWQYASVKALRANVFFFPYGVLGLPGVPRQRDMSLLVAEPIRVPRVESPTAEQTALLHRRYMTSLREAFDRFKTEADYSHKTLVFEPEVEPLGKAEWEAAAAEFATGARQDGGTLDSLYPSKGGDRLELTATALWWMGIFSYIFVRCLNNTEKFVLDAIFDDA